MPSGFGDVVTRWPPRTVCSAPRTASWPAPWRSSSACASPPDSATPSSRCSVETYSSPRRRASPSACSMTFFARGSSVSDPPWTRARLARAAAISPRKAVRSTPRRRSVSAGMPSSGPTRAASRCSASSTGLSHPLGKLLGGNDGLLGLLGEAVELHGSRIRFRWSGGQVVRWSGSGGPRLRWSGGPAGGRGRETSGRRRSPGRRGRTAARHGPSRTGPRNRRPSSSACPGP